MILQNLNNIRNAINEKCREIGRSPDSVKLIAVSKRKPLSAIEEVFKLGIVDFGENKAQELKEKASETSLELNWHFIGHLQSNKVKQVIAHTDLIHSLDSIKLAAEIEKRAGNINKIQNVLIEIKTSSEESKFGLTEYDDILNLANFCKESQNLNLIGLMTMAEYSSDENVIRNSFKSLRNIFVKLNNDGFDLSELSMGMTGDFKIAIEEGATLIRIGTAIFGER